MVTGEKAQGTSGSNGASAYEIYKKYNPEYAGTEEEWINQFGASNTSLCTVTFNPNNGSNTFQNKVFAGNAVTKPTDPEKEDCYFKGWYDANGEKWSFLGNVVSSDITLTAKYQRTPLGENLAEPTVSLVNVDSTVDSITFDIFETDVDSVCRIDQAELYLNNELIETKTDFTNKTFTNLLSNNEYTIKLIYSYDLNDGNNRVSKNLTYNKKTVAKTEGVVSFTTVDSSYDSITFDYELVDPNNTVTVNSYEIFKGDALVSTITDTTTKSFANLLSDSEYTVIINYTVDFNDGTQAKAASVTTTKKTVKINEPTVAITYLLASTTAITFDIQKTDPDNVLVLESADAVKNDEVLATITDLTSPQFANLLTNSKYNIVLHYNFNLNDGAGVQTKTVTAVKYTLAELTPSIRFENVTATYNSISFGLEQQDPNNKVTISSVDLYKNGVKVDTLTSFTSTNTFANLLSNVEYEMYVNYSYNLNDGAGIIRKSYNTKITTLELHKPIISFTNVALTASSINADVVFRDIDNVGSIAKIELFDGTTLLATNSSANTQAKKISFSGFTKSDTIRIHITYKYNLNDGNGDQTEVMQVTPYNTITNLEIANTSAISYGETIVIQADVTNFEGVSFVSLEVNGATYAVDPASTSTRLICNIANTGQFAGGNTDLTVTKINTTGMAIVPAENNVLTTYINPAIFVDSISLVDKNFKCADFITAEDMVSKNGKKLSLVYINLDNNGDYEIQSLKFMTSIEISSSSRRTSSINATPIKINSNNWYCLVSLPEGMLNLTLEEYTYSIGDNNKTVFTNKTSTAFVTSEKITHITNANELIAINKKTGHFVLDNDIDLASIEWTPLDANGIFDGNGHTIKNLSIVKSISNTNAYLGLFSSFGGVINDLTIEDIVISVDIISDSTSTYNCYYGGFVSKLNTSITIKNCKIIGNSIITVNNKSNGKNYLGGFVGYSEVDNLVVNNCNNSSNITSNAKYNYSGVVVSYIGGTDLKACNIINTGSINVEGSGHSEIYGIFGYYSYGSLNISNYLSLGSIPLAVDFNSSSSVYKNSLSSNGTYNDEKKRIVQLMEI